MDPYIFAAPVQKTSYMPCSCTLWYEILSKYMQIKHIYISLDDLGEGIPIANDVFRVESAFLMLYFLQKHGFRRTDGLIGAVGPAGINGRSPCPSGSTCCSGSCCVGKAVCCGKTCCTQDVVQVETPHLLNQNAWKVIFRTSFPGNLRDMYSNCGTPWARAIKLEMDGLVHVSIFKSKGCHCCCAQESSCCKDSLGDDVLLGLFKLAH